MTGVKISVSSDERTGVADAVVDELRRRGHEPLVHGALADGERADWAWASEAAARDVAAGARKWNDANVLALSLRGTSEALLGEILDAWFGAGPSEDTGDVANVRHLDEI
jgi:ribose 5-phosphate isomerase B